MTGSDYEVGFGRPPRSSQFQKGQSGNPRGRRQKPPATIAGIVESVLMAPAHPSAGSEKTAPTVFQLVSQQLLVKVSQANKRAHSILRSYQAFAAERPAIRYVRLDPGAYGRLLETDELQPRRRRKSELQTSKTPLAAQPLSEEVKTRRWLDERIARMRAGLEMPEIHKGMTAAEASEMYQLLLDMPDTPPKRRWRKKSGKNLAASEIFAEVIYAPVVLRQGETDLSVSRMEAAIRVLASKAVKGHLPSADMLMVLHAASIKHGDFCVRPKVIRR